MSHTPPPRRSIYILENASMSIITIKYGAQLFNCFTISTENDRRSNLNLVKKNITYLILMSIRHYSTTTCLGTLDTSVNTLSVTFNTLFVITLWGIDYYVSVKFLLHYRFLLHINQFSNYQLNVEKTIPQTPWRRSVINLSIQSQFSVRPLLMSPPPHLPQSTCDIKGFGKCSNLPPIPPCTHKHALWKTSQLRHMVT